MKGLGLLLAFLVLWDVGWSLAGVNQMMPWRLKSLLREQPEKVRLIDVRTDVEYKLFHIPGAQHRPDLLLDPTLLEAPADPETATVIICMTGHRSPLVAKGAAGSLTESKVYNLTWGMLGWLLTAGRVTRD